MARSDREIIEAIPGQGGSGELRIVDTQQFKGDMSADHGADIFDDSRYRHLIVVKGSIGSQNDLNLVIDTGASETVITFVPRSTT